MLQVATVVAISASLLVVCKSDCGLSTALPPKSRSWTISSNATLHFVGNQICRWRLPTQPFPNDILLIHISPFDFRSNRTCLADLSFDDRMLKCTATEPQCILFMENLTTVDFHRMQERFGYESGSCKIWKVEKGRLRTVTLRTFNPDRGLSFKVKWQYIAQSKKVANTTSTTSENVTTTTYTSVTNTTTPRFDDKDQQACAGCTGYIIAFAITLFLLCVAIIVLARCAHMWSLMSGKRHPRVRGSFFQTESIDDEVDKGMLSSPVPLSTPKSPERQGNTSYFFKRTEGTQIDENRGYVQFPQKKGQSTFTTMKNNVVTNSEETHYAVPSSVPLSAGVRRKSEPILSLE